MGYSRPLSTRGLNFVTGLLHRPVCTSTIWIQLTPVAARNVTRTDQRAMMMMRRRSGAHPVPQPTSTRSAGLTQQFRSSQASSLLAPATCDFRQESIFLLHL
ncbi:hypothetical protein CC85DRAFT_146480 [Cutaneotrichosporon oleaginosum]|uniref:Uncharacterized protein n=1 Tax=Cutaneotrichosporon oleaginosum TaxID=879819 RepID=A0A0J0XHT7_9TREE|nr:uncharacterized protein CC85DRAFT_146480 [Cutaneotrichosporon oleaginosum]KLT40572.1 hypothetical protein CC85DRAFT_146480 [Cutaneotrichosporon oleaginosum]TXT03898.1 hypothetical protein COLE_07595 [Cutaneotrichosporon oleaginosum]